MFNSEAFSKKQLLNYIGYFKVFVEFLTLFVVEFVVTVAMIILLVLISVVEIHRIQLGISTFEKIEGYSWLASTLYMLGLFIFTAILTTAKYKANEEFNSTQKTRGFLLNLIKFVWVDVIGLGKIGKFGFDKQEQYTSHLDSFKTIEQVIIFSAGIIAGIGSLKEEINKYQGVQYLEAIYKIFTESDLPTMSTFIMAVIFTVVIITVGIKVTEHIVLQALDFANKTKEEIQTQETAGNIYLKDITSTHDRYVFEIVNKFKERINENDYIVFEENAYQIFDGKANAFVISRNSDTFKSITTLYRNLNIMLEARNE